MASHSRPVKIPRVGASTRPTILAIPFGALLGLAAAPGAAPLPPVPDADFSAFASVAVDNGVLNVGGPGSQCSTCLTNRGFPAIFG